MRVAYPGLWVRPDVYATHGHYLDCHLTVPTLERLSVGAMSRLLGRRASAFSAVGDYEAVGAPVFAWRDAVARDARTGAALNGMATVAAWSMLGGAPRRWPPRKRSQRRWPGQQRSQPRWPGSGDGRGSRDGRRSREPPCPARRACAPVPSPPASRSPSPRSTVRASARCARGLAERAASRGPRAMGEVAARLDLGDVIRGLRPHPPRGAASPATTPAEWRARGGARLVNAGSWTYSSIFLTDTPGESPYWPGTCVLVEDEGPPRLLRLLRDRTRAELAAGLSRSRSASTAR